MISRIFVCSKEGFRKKDKRDLLSKKPRTETRTSCNVQLFIKLNKKKKNYYVYHFVEIHNHPFVREECAHMLPSQRRISTSQAIEIDLAEASGISPKSSFELMGNK